MPEDWFTQKDNEHLAALSSLSPEAGDALSLATASVAHAMVPLAQTSIPTDALFANAVAGTACFSLTHRLLRASLLLLHFGYYEGVPSLLRSAYEAAECGHYLSKNPDAAEKWLSRNTNWPRKDVRDRLGGVTRGEQYGRHYGLLSSLTHPTPKAGMWCVQVDDEALRPRLFREIDSEQVRFDAIWLASVAVFTCFAMRNASPEGALEPRWLQGLAELAKEVSKLAGAKDQDWSHLDQDWEAAQARWQRITARLRSNEELERALDEHPWSWRRASREVQGNPGSRG